MSLWCKAYFIWASCYLGYKQISCRDDLAQPKQQNIWSLHTQLFGVNATSVTEIDLLLKKHVEYKLQFSERKKKVGHGHDCFKKPKKFCDIIRYVTIHLECVIKNKNLKNTSVDLRRAMAVAASGGITRRDASALRAIASWEGLVLLLLNTKLSRAFLALVSRRVAFCKLRRFMITLYCSAYSVIR